MSRSIWVRRFIPFIDLEAVRVRQESDEYKAKTNKEFPFTVKDADVQPVKGHELMTLEEGYRTKSVYKVYTPTLISAGKEGTNSLPDKIKYKDIWFTVFRVEHWADGLDEHCCAYMVSDNRR